MSYQKFMDDVVKHISEAVHDGQKVTLQPVLKNNGTVYDGLIIMDPLLNISPTIYLNQYYHRFLNGVSMEDIYEDILETYYKNLPDKDFDISLFRDFENAKKRITFKLVNKERNKELLDDVPYVEFCDLVLIFVCVITEFTDEYATILIHNEHLSLWKTTTEELYSIAKQNTPTLLPHRLDKMEDILENITQENFHEEVDSKMYVLTNNLKIHGSSCIAYPGLLKTISEHFNDNLIIIPSSIHEVLILPESAVNSKYTMEEYRTMITEINETELTDDEILSEHAYFYEKNTELIS